MFSHPVRSFLSYVLCHNYHARKAFSTMLYDFPSSIGTLSLLKICNCYAETPYIKYSNTTLVWKDCGRKEVVGDRDQ